MLGFAPIASDPIGRVRAAPVAVPAHLGNNRFDTTGSTTAASLTSTGINTVGGTGSIIHVQAVVSTSTGTPTLTDNKGNVGWTLVSSASRGIGATYYLWRFVSPVGGANHTVTVTLGTGTGPITLSIVETLACQLDATTNYTADAAAPYQVAITTTGSSDVVLVFNSSDTAGYGAPYASLNVYVDTGSGWSLASGYAVGVAAGAQTITVNSAGSTDFQIAAVAVKRLVSGTVYNDTLTESVLTADVLTTIRTMVNALAESVATADALTATRTTTDALTESVATADALTGGLLLTGALTESVATADSLASVQTMPNALTESVATADALAQAMTMASTLTESTALGDALSSTQVMPNTLTESVAPADALSLGSVYNDALTESVAATDALSSTQVMPNTLTESVAPLDNLAALMTMVGALAESIAAADSLASTQTLSAALTESTTLADAVVDAGSPPPPPPPAADANKHMFRRRR